MQVFCICGKRLAYVEDSTNREMSGWCEECSRTGDCRKSIHWSDPPAPKAAKPAFKTKDTVEKVEWTKNKGGRNDGYRVGR